MPIIHQRRSVPLGTVRATGGENGQPMRLEGLAVPFGVPTPMPVYSPGNDSLGRPLPRQREIIDPEAFDINPPWPIYLFWNHDPSRVLGNTQSGNLRLWKEPDGIHYECVLSDTPEDRYCWTQVRLKRTPCNSFGFDDIKRKTIPGDPVNDPNGISLLVKGDIHELSCGVPFAANPNSTYSEARTMPISNNLPAASGHAGQPGAKPANARAINPGAIQSALENVITLLQQDITMDGNEPTRMDPTAPADPYQPDPKQTDPKQTDPNTPPPPQGRSMHFPTPPGVHRNQPATQNPAPPAPAPAQPDYLQQMRTIADDLLRGVEQAKTLSQRGQIARMFPQGQSDFHNTTRSFGGFLLAIRDRDHKTLERSYQSRVMTGGGGGTGGFLIPTEFVSELYKVDAETAIVRPRAAQLPMGSRTLQIPYLDQYSTPSTGNSAFLGGVAAAWTEEGKPLSEQTPNLKQLELTAHELSGYTKVTNSMMADSAIGLDSLLTQLFGQSIRWYEDFAFLLGDGVGKPLGAFASANPVALSVTRQTASTFTYVDAVKMLSRLLPGSNPDNTAWIMSITAMEKFLQLSDAGGNNIIIIPNVLGGGASRGPVYNLLNFPVIFTEKLPALGTARDVCLGNFSKYVLGDRQTPSIDYSEHADFTNNNAVWRFILRLDARPWMKSSITLQDGTNKVSPFVYLS